MDYAKRAEEIANTDYIARAAGALLHDGRCGYLLGKTCDCEMRENVETVADVLRAGDMAHLAELRAAHDAGVASKAAEVAALRQIICDAARECGGMMSPECSLEFMALLQREIALAIRRAKEDR